MCRAASPGVDAADQPASEVVHVGLPAAGWSAAVLHDLDRFHALVVGPGLGRTEAAVAGVRELVADVPVPTVVDADGLYALGSPVSLHFSGAPVVLTPHDGEFARLRGGPVGTDRLGAARALAADTGAVVLLKGPTTVVAAPTGEVLLSVAGDARLATAGSGDVLAGVVGAFLAAGMPAFEAAGLGAHIHGRAAGRGRSVGLIAGDLPELVSLVLSASEDEPGPVRASGGGAG
jgi:NAD(P)H-hydrate epimerase